MKKNENVKWRRYELSYLFKITSTKSSIDRNKLNGISGKSPYITRTDMDNGMDSFIAEQPNYCRDEGNVITIGLDTQTVFYQPTSFYTGQNIQVLRSEHLNKYIALYIVPLIKKQMEKFNWGGNGATLGRLKKVSLLLPSIDEKNPDYLYMEEYMKQLEKKLLTMYKNYIGKKNIKSQNGGGNMKDCRWKDFPIKELGEIKSGQDIYERDRKDGDTPYVTATALQNGIGYFVGNNNETLSEGCISINRNGSVGYAFYHPYYALFGNDTRRLFPHKKNRWVNFFIARAITQQREKYSYGLKLGTDRLKKQSVMLPITPDDQIDYEYMETYMRNIEFLLINRYIDKRLKSLETE